MENLNTSRTTKERKSLIKAQPAKKILCLINLMGEFYLTREKMSTFHGWFLSIKEKDTFFS